MHNRDMIVIGCGTGRSGTLTLARVLDACEGIECTHERWPRLTWNPDADSYAERLAWLREGHSDVAFYYLPYLRCLLVDEPDARIIVTRRDPEEVACSFENLIGPRVNYWLDHHGQGWDLNDDDATMPKYDIQDRHTAIVQYARDYDAEIDRLAAEYPENFLIVATHTLGDKATQRRIFDHARISGRARRYSPDAHHNQSPTDRSTPQETAPLIIGTYRKRLYIEECLRSAERHLSGYSDVIFVDDSGDDAHAAWLAQHGKVVATGGIGYMRAFQKICDVAAGQQAFVLEEDFRFTVDVDIADLSVHLHHRPYLSQVALLRGPVYEPEIEAGGVLKFLAAQGRNVTHVHGLDEVTNMFTCNPSLWRGHTSTLGWPQRVYSEVAKAQQLSEAGYRMAYLPGIGIEHVGEDKTGGHSY